MSSFSRTNLTICILLVLLTSAVFWGITGNDFINYDDIQYIQGNRHVSTGLSKANVVWAFTSIHASNWHPLTWLSHMVDVELFGLNPHGHHFMGLLFHAANTSLLFLLLVRLTGATWRSAVVAALFAIHPLHVESVAWASERKDLLSTCFGFISMLFYVSYIKQKRLMRYFAAITCFALSLLAKPMLVTLPFILLLLDYWPLCRFGSGTAGSNNEQDRHKGDSFRKLVQEKMPFFLLSALSSVITLYAQRHGDSIASFVEYPLSYRSANALIAYLGYLAKTFWPQDLAVLYPLHRSVPLWQSVSADAVLLVISLLALVMRLRRPYFIVGWLWFIGMLVPVIGLVQVGGQSMADRYTYIPLVGIFIVVVWAVSALFAHKPYRLVVLVTTTLFLLLISSIVTWRQVRFWKNSTTLFAHALAVTVGNAIAHNNLGNALYGKGKVDEAMIHFNEALRIDPFDAIAHNNLGIALDKMGRADEAIFHFNNAVRIDPSFFKGHFNLGEVYARRGKIAEAVFHYSKALKLQPDFTDTHINMGIILASQGNLDEAVDHFTTALGLMPDLKEGHYNLALALEMMGRTDEAIKQYCEALRIDPEYAESHNNLGVALLRQEKYDDAMRHFLQALRLRPDFADARQNLENLVKQKSTMPGRK